MNYTNYIKSILDRKFKSKEDFLSGFKSYTEFILIDTTELEILEISMCARKIGKDCKLFGKICGPKTSTEFNLLLSEIYNEN